MVEDRAFIEDDLGDGIGEVSNARHPEVVFEDRSLAVAADDDESPAVPNHRGLRSQRRRSSRDWLRNHLAGRDVDEGAVVQEGGVQGRESMVLEVGIARKMQLDQLGVLGDGLREAGDDDPFRERRSIVAKQRLLGRRRRAAGCRARPPGVASQVSTRMWSLGWPSWNGTRVSGASGVKRQSSSSRVGKPSAVSA